MAIDIKLQAFEGPLDLLLHLIDINKIDIYDIPIAKITDQYLDYIHQLQEQDIELMSEFLVMAATLLRIKSKMLLPRIEDEEVIKEDPREELVARLLEHKMYKYMAMELKDRQIDAEKTVFKGMTMPKDMKYTEPPVDLDALVGNLDYHKLHEIFKEVLKRQENLMDPVRSKYGRIEQEEVSLGDRIEALLVYGRDHHTFTFQEILSMGKSRTFIVVTFLAILEMMKSGDITIEQKELFDDIKITMNHF